MSTEKLYTEKQLRDAFYSSIAYWSPKYGWEEGAFLVWKREMLERQQQELANGSQTSEEVLGYGVMGINID
jgi:hypothetical protein